MFTTISLITYMFQDIWTQSGLTTPYTLYILAVFTPLRYRAVFTPQCTVPTRTYLQG